MEHETGVKLAFWVTTIFIFLFMMGIIFLSTTYLNRTNKRKKEEFNNLLKASLAVEKRERKRIASDLHDSTSGDVASVRNYIALLYRQEQDESKKNILSEVEINLENILYNIQNISYNLMPPTLDRLGLVSTIKSYFERIRKWNELEIHEEYYMEQIPISSFDAYEVYRILQELITNMIEHGEVTTINFSIQDRWKYLLLEIADDGGPFDFYKCLNNSSGMGLKNIASRIQQIHAELVQPASKKGNTLHIHLKKINNNATYSHNRRS